MLDEQHLEKDSLLQVENEVDFQLAPSSSELVLEASRYDLDLSSQLQEPSSFDSLMKIVIAVEKHEHSEYMLSWALENFLDSKKHLVYLLTVTKDSPQAAMIYSASVDGGVPSNTIDDINYESTHKAKLVLLKYYEMIMSHFGNGNAPITHCILGHGDKREQICEVVKKTKAHLLLLGQKGSSPLKRFIYGSTGDFCIHNAHCPILLIKMDQL